MQLSIVNEPQNGQLGEINQENGTVSYTPNEGFTGSDTFTYKVNDGTSDSNEATVTINVQAPPNKPPTAQAGNATIIQATPKDIKLNATDPDAEDKLQLSIVNEPQNGQLGEINQENGTVSYTPNEGFTGSDTFTYKVNDGTSDSNEATVTINVQALTTPSPTLPSIPTSEQKEVKDSDNDGIAYSIDSTPNKKSMEFSNSDRTAFGSILDSGNQTLNIRQVDENRIMIISESNTGEYPALINICNQSEYYIETNDNITITCAGINNNPPSTGNKFE